MDIYRPANKFVSSDRDLKAIAKGIRRNCGSGNFRQIVLRIISCYIKAKCWEDLSPIEWIMLELDWINSTEELLSFGNKGVMHSIYYRLREETLEEEV